MKRRSRYKNSNNVSLVAGIIVMAVTAVALGYLLGNWMIKFVTGSEINPVATEPNVKEEIIIDNDTEEKDSEQESEEMATIEPPGSDTTPSTYEGELFVVQLGAFNKYSNAVDLRDELLTKGYNSVMITEGPPYKVQLRASKTREDAETIEEQVREDGFVDVFIVH